MLRILTGVMLFGLLAIPANAADYYGSGSAGQPYRSGHHTLPVCDEAAVVSRVAEKFAYYDAHVILSGLAIQHIDGISERKVNVDGPSLIPRRYCNATAWLTNGQQSEVVYLIEFQTGFASLSWNVQSCVPGFDPYRVYGAGCRSIRP